MIQLVTLAEVKTSLNIVSADDDQRILMLIRASSEAIINYLKSAADAFYTTGSDEVDTTLVPEVVKFATIYLVSTFYRNPDGDPDGAFVSGFLPAPVVSLLTPLRDPALA